ncbi:MTAP family purine nucleoside phosphorylase [Paraliobacillus sp. X-1268]|uniref:MTAP family purine nucleoside phosphorylase n=1 Tax=Paraliobacillus sp. X-1268 TaxID=2213193 RepID=UPI000E3EBEE1|nr:MTAP family purine nucleoside phosphorylase [Paraliobacillus sp. X-1268]
MKIGIIGGGEIANRDCAEIINIVTPYGEVSSPILKERINCHEIYVLARHGHPHVLSPSHVNYRANIYAMKKIGVDVIIGPTACGSLTEKFQVGDLILPNQLIDFTKDRISSFNSSEELRHVSMADPFCEELRNSIKSEIKNLKYNYYDTGTLISIEGPAFSSRAESYMYRLWGAHLINMTTATEAKLAKEAGVCYQPIALITDMDCWDVDNSPVSLNLIYENINTTAPRTIRKIIRKWVESISNTYTYKKCDCCEIEDILI